MGQTVAELFAESSWHLLAVAANAFVVGIAEFFNGIVQVAAIAKVEERFCPGVIGRYFEEGEIVFQIDLERIDAGEFLLVHCVLLI